ncbi:hypothetical protein EON65_24050 [archaeon]|nr:MAG: hypothetical protein EON65_24050 [archaeon]
MLMGTLVYSEVNDLGWAMGLYLAVNVGYSIDSDYPIKSNYGVMWYSVAHVHISASFSFFSCSLGYFANNMIAVLKE